MWGDSHLGPARVESPTPILVYDAAALNIGRIQHDLPFALTAYARQAYFRNMDQREIDLLVEYDGMLYPVEWKKSATLVGLP